MRKTPLLPATAAAAGIFGGVFALPTAQAACTPTFNPGTGQTVTCDASPPATETTPIAAQPGSTNVAVHVLAGATLQPGGNNAVLLRDQSVVSIAGTIDVSGNTFDGLSLQGTGNSATNSGTIHTTGTQSEAMFTTGNGNMMLNDIGGQITIDGSSHALLSFGGSNNSLINAGTITLGPGAADASALRAAIGGSGNTLINAGTGLITASAVNGLGFWVANSASSAVINDGSIQTSGDGGIAIFSFGNDITITNRGTIETSGANAHGIESTGGSPTVGAILNTGTIATLGNGSGIVVGRFATITNTAGALISSGAAFGIFSSSGATIDNAGAIRSEASGLAGILLSQGGTVTNLAGGLIHGQIQGINSFGAAAAIDNAGTIESVGGPALRFSDGFDNSVVTSGTIIGGNGIAAQFDLGGDAMTVTGGFVTGDVNQSAGDDRFTLRGGTVTGNVSQGDDADDFSMSAGTMNGTLDQGSGPGDGADSFSLSGGTISGDVNQGGQFDMALISGGTIAGALNDGDFLTITGGQVGSVDLKLADNVLTMSGGLVVGNVDAGLHDDTLHLSNGRIGGAVDFGSGNDVVNVSGGSIGGTVLSGIGSDTLNWAGGGRLESGFELGDGNDIAVLRNLTPAFLAPGIPLDGGNESDTLTFDNTGAADVTRFLDWELFELSNSSQLTFSSTLVLGDAGTGTGTLSVDSTSTIFAGNGSHSIEPFAAGLPVTVNNAGMVDLTNGPAAATDSLTIAGNYAGLGGSLGLETVLGADGSPSDRLVIAGGTGSGSTTIQVTNLGGSGALTVADGILLVEATGGATTSPGAFSLRGVVAAGVFEYRLFRGGVMPGAEDDWFLRSRATVIPPPPLPPGSPLPPPSASPSPAGAPLIRPEVPGHAILPAVARRMGLATIGTFHARQGDQLLLRSNAAAPAAWGRVFAATHDQQWDAQIAGLDFQLGPAFDGGMHGLQAGLDLFGIDREDGSQDRGGLFYTHARAGGDVAGFTLGMPDNPSGRLTLQADSVGAYWTRLGSSGWYLDAVALHTWLSGDAASDRGFGAKSAGTVFAASLEGGYPLVLGDGWTLEPQAQAVWQHVDVNRAADRFSNIAYNATDAFSGRLGLRLEGNIEFDGGGLRPYLEVSVWHDFGADDVVLFNATGVTVEGASTALVVAGGASALISDKISVYGELNVSTDLGDGDVQAVGGHFGIRLQW